MAGASKKIYHLPHCPVLCSLEKVAADLFPISSNTLLPQTRLKRAEVEVAVLQQKKDREILELQEQVMRLSFSLCCL